MTTTRERCGACLGEGDAECMECDGTGYVTVLQHAPEPDEPTYEGPSPVFVELNQLQAKYGDAVEQIRCMVCNAAVDYPKFIVEFVRAHNRREDAKAKASEHEPYPYVPQLVGKNQIGTCEGACSIEYRNRMNRDAEQRFKTTQGYLADLKAGRPLSPHAERWLRQNGHTRELERYYKVMQEKPAEGGAS